jgi:hypothetical protein
VPGAHCVQARGTSGVVTTPLVTTAGTMTAE